MPTKQGRFSQPPTSNLSDLTPPTTQNYALSQRSGVIPGARSFERPFQGLMTTVHAMTATQLTVDGPSRGGKEARVGCPCHRGMGNSGSVASVFFKPPHSRIRPAGVLSDWAGFLVGLAWWALCFGEHHSIFHRSRQGAGKLQS